ncbi:hypothetical protein [Estrella lausannensis]|uniref:Putative membrane protein n=1 Tax=Estrella lausannensis TaxID=483423 RepID=A0A0H5DPC9_9BACT|nr:hypothetical protein [Estrella lausannensis]CRX38396.1 putative membrane protein [Estrella lausannensis]
MSTIISRFNHEYGIYTPAQIGSLAITPTAFFKSPEGRVWKEGMDSFINDHPAVRFNRGKLIAHILELAVKAHRQNILQHLIKDYIAANINAYDFELKPGDVGYQEEQVQSAALSALRLIGIVFLNIVTLGIASIVWLAFLKSRVEVLDGETTELKQFEAYQASRLNETAPAKDRIRNLFTEHGRIEQRARQLNEQLQGLVEQRNLRANASSAQEQISQIIAEREELEADIANLLGAADDDVSIDINPLTSSISKKLGYVEPLYKKREGDDINISGKYKDKKKTRVVGGIIQKNQWGVPIQDTIPSEQGKWLNGKSTMEDLLGSAADWAMLNLLQKADEGEIRFNKSYQLAEASEAAKQYQLAIFKHMVFLMLDAAGVTADCTLVPHVILNEDGKGGSLQVDPSIAYRAEAPDGSKDVILYKNRDGWSPSDPSKFPRGIDPLAAKWILARYEDEFEEMKTLEKLLLKPLLTEPLDLEGVNKDLLIANELIEEIALALMDRYHGLFTTKLNHFATDNVATLDSLDQEAKSVDWSNVSKPWLNQEIRSTLLKSHRILTGLSKRGSQLLHESIDDKSKTLTLPADSSKALEEIKKFFRVIHLDINEGGNLDHGCLFSSLSISLLQGAGNKAEISPLRIRQAMAGCIEKNSVKWSQKIMERTRKRLPGKTVMTEGWTTDQYCKWLRGQDPGLKPTQAKRLRDDYNELELEVFANAFGIEVNVFVSGQVLRKDKKDFKSYYTYGPKTKEKLYLFNSQALSFYAITPKLTEREEGLDMEAKALVGHHQRFWARNCDENLADFDTGWNHFQC